MIENMIQIKLVVEGMKTEIVKCFDAKHISKSIKIATEKAVDAFDMGTFIENTIEDVFSQAHEIAIGELSERYGSRWADDLSIIIDRKIEQALKDHKGDKNGRKND